MALTCFNFIFAVSASSKCFLLTEVTTLWPRSRCSHLLSQSLNEQLGLWYKDISPNADFHSAFGLQSINLQQSVNACPKILHTEPSVCNLLLRHLCQCFPSMWETEAASEGGATWLGMCSPILEISMPFVTSQCVDFCAFQHTLWNIQTDFSNSTRVLLPHT